MMFGAQTRHPNGRFSLCIHAEMFSFFARKHTYIRISAPRHPSPPAAVKRTDTQTDTLDLNFVSAFSLCVPLRFLPNEQKYDVGQQTHLPFQEFEGNFSPSAKRALEAALQAALDEESSKAKNGGGGKDAMDTDNATDSTAQSKKRSRPTRSTSAAAVAAEAGVKRETSDGKKDPAATGVRKVYKLADFQGYQEMKEQVCVCVCMAVLAEFVGRISFANYLAYCRGKWRVASPP